MYTPRDIQEFLDDYPDVTDDPSCTANLKFYSNNLRCRPDNRTIEEIHEKSERLMPLWWFGEYGKLEAKHGYIQWLFPIREYGMNYESQPLQAHEIDAMKADPVVIQRVTESYKLMLDFYGMHLVSEETGLVGRALPPRNYAARYYNLVRSSHNYLRISRILKCLSEMELERLNAGFLLHVLNEQSEENELNTRGICNSMDTWWANCLRNKEERTWIGALIRRVRSADENGFIFTREDYEEALRTRAETGQLGIRDKKETNDSQTSNEEAST
ncbi:opioid growth factor receptor conserved region-domain-containing protein [Gymnopilus junonius]|uniref:Opioid growth factor receptor conserved region-domain-containing protein n=1 Tax=Gymnopilus junonius TaxID=109634 RepID=A0A9P5NNJ6_GYMJU|nr:opioid growth factor receptor conserved region-domain-containing protein [Gymnopilus junonius]